MTIVAHVRPRTAACRGACSAARRYPDHHDRLTTVDTDVDALLGLMELAVTWHELDWSESHVLGPAEWATFAAAHVWTDPQRADRAFGLAVDIVGRCHVPG